MTRVAEELVASGYDGVELRIVDNAVIDPAALDRGARKELRRTFHSRGLEIIAVGASSRFNTPVVADRRSHEQSLIDYLQLASDLDSPMVRTFGGAVPDGCTLEQGQRWVAESLNRVAPRAEELGVNIVLETHDGFASAAAVAGTLAMVESPAVGILWDTHHPFRMGETVEQAWELTRNRLYHVHVKDARRTADGKWDLKLLGQGEVPVAEAVRTLKAGGYAGWISVEWEKKWHPEIEDPEVAIPQHAQVLRQYLQG